MRKRQLRAIVVCIIICFVDLWASNGEIYINLYEKHIINETAFNEFLVTGNYHSPIKYSFMYVFVFLFYIRYVLGSQLLQVIVRAETRETYWKNWWKKALWPTVLFVLVHELESIGFILVYGNISILVDHHWIMAVMVQILAGIGFYLEVFLVFCCVESYIEKQLAQLLTTMFFVVQYFIVYRYYSIWLPVEDVVMMPRICGNGIDMVQVVCTLLRFIAFNWILYQIYIAIKNREDYISDERR